MLRFAIVNDQNIVENIIVWDGIEPWSPCHESDELHLIEGISCAPGMNLNADGTFSYPVQEVIE
jgi:hypothetical protein